MNTMVRDCAMDDEIRRSGTVLLQVCSMSMVRVVVWVLYRTTKDLALLSFADLRWPYQVQIQIPTPRLVDPTRRNLVVSEDHTMVKVHPSFVVHLALLSVPIGMIGCLPVRIRAFGVWVVVVQGVRVYLDGGRRAVKWAGRVV